MYKLFLLLADGDIPGRRRDKPARDTHDVQQVSSLEKNHVNPMITSRKKRTGGSNRGEGF
jgi:hypothetical protein